MTPANRAEELIKTAIRDGGLSRYLYKYRPFNNYTESIFSENSLWFSKPSAFNDPFDCQIFDATVYTPEEVETYLLERAGADLEMARFIAGKYRSTPDYFLKMLEEVKQQMIGSKGILSLSEFPDNILMWSHYAESHSGFVLGFDVLKDIPFFTRPVHVRYDKNYPAFKYLKEPDKIASHGMLTKSELWRYEGEVRVVKENFGKYQFAKECLKEVIFGCRIDPANRDAIIQYLKKYGYDGVSLKEANPSKTSFAIEITPLKI
jgi:hypothetical protein